MLILGPRGSGKSTQARFLADKLSIFHIKFRDFLQEIIIGKTKKRIEPERDEEKALEENEEEQEEEEEEDEDSDSINHKIKSEKQENKKNQVEEKQIELNEKEETIKAFLERDEQLPNDIFDEVVGNLWTEEPYKTRGFILEDFPSNETHAQYIIEKGFYPDAVIILNVEDEDIIKRLLPARLQAWKDKMKTKKEKRKQKALKKKEKLMKKIKKRRDEEIAKYEERRLKREQEAAENGEELEEEEFNVDEIIQEEFQNQLQEEEEEFEDAQEDDVKENIASDIRTNYENQINSIDSIKVTLNNFKHFF